MSSTISSSVFFLFFPLTFRFYYFVIYLFTFNFYHVRKSHFHVWKNIIIACALQPDNLIGFHTYCFRYKARGLAGDNDWVTSVLREGFKWYLVWVIFFWKKSKVKHPKHWKKRERVTRMIKTMKTKPIVTD